MKAQRVLAALLVVSLTLVPLIPLQATARTPYTETLNLFVAGSNVMWSLRMGGINASNAHLTQVEAISGVSWYNVTAINTAGMTSDFQVFGPNGYNLIPLPFVPQQGLFLGVGASSYGDALSAAHALGPYFLTTFSSVTNGTNVYYFFSPLSLGSLIPSTLMRYIPVSDGGFAAALGYTSSANSGNFTAQPGAMVTLGGQRTSSGFYHYLTMSAMKAKALSSTNVPTILNDLGTKLTVLQASNKSTSSVIAVHSLDGIVLPTNATGVVNDMQHFSGDYTLTVAPGSFVRALNVSLLQQPPELLVTRSMDAGVLSHNDNVSVTISFRNLSNSTTVTGTVLNDDWWRPYGFLKLVHGQPDMAISKLAPGASTDLTYELQYTANSTQQANIPTATATYGFVTTDPKTGKEVNSTLALSSSVNGGVLLLGPKVPVGLGVQEPVLIAYLTTSKGFGGPVGSTQELKATIKNIGTRTASNVIVNGVSEPDLTAGNSLTIPMPVRAASLVGSSTNQLVSVSYVTPEGQKVSLATNSLEVVFSHSSMNLGLGTLGVNSTIAPLSAGRTNLTLTFTTKNAGVANLTSIVASGSLPAGLGCGRSFGNGISCSSGVISLSYTNLRPGGANHASMNFNLTSAQNLILSPFTLSYNASGYQLSGRSNGTPVPAGLTISKTFDPSLLFVKMRSAVSVTAGNSGPFSLYNFTLASSSDSFDSVPLSGPPTRTTNATLSPGGSLHLGYNVTLGTDTGNQTGASVSTSFFFGGVGFSSTHSGGSVAVYSFPSVSIVSIPSSPVEGKPFSLIINISNPSPLALSNVQFSLPLPSEVHFTSLTNATVSGGKIQITAARLAGEGSYVANLTGSSSSGVSIPFSGEKFTFAYAGQTLTVPSLSNGVAINEDVITRYVLPVGLALLVLLAVAVFIRRMAGATSPASPQ